MPEGNGTESDFTLSEELEQLKCNSHGCCSFPHFNVQSLFKELFILPICSLTVKEMQLLLKKTRHLKLSKEAKYMPKSWGHTRWKIGLIHENYFMLPFLKRLEDFEEPLSSSAPIFFSSILK